MASTANEITRVASPTNLAPLAALACLFVRWTTASSRARLIACSVPLAASDTVARNVLFNSVERLVPDQA